MSIRPIDRTLSGDTTTGQSGTKNNGNEEVQKPQHYWSLNFRLFSVIFRTHFWRAYPSAETQSMYLTVPKCKSRLTKEFHQL